MHLHYEIHGTGPTTLVMTHGLGMNSRAWKAQVDGLSKDFRVVTWDLRGHGRSEAADSPFVLRDLAEDLRRLLDQIGVARAVVLGHSAGGVISMRFAIDHPERTAGLVVIGSASKCNQKSADFYESLARQALDGGIEPARQRLGLKEDRGATDPATFAGILRCISNILHEPLTPELDRILCPTLIVVGEKDFIGVGGSVIMSRHIAGSRLEIVSDRGHSVFLEDPDGFNSMLRGFVSGLNSDRSS